MNQVTITLALSFFALEVVVFIHALVSARMKAYPYLTFKDLVIANQPLPIGGALFLAVVAFI
ncbi:hypothetical protein L1D52_23980 [Vibrio brasiliensis]|uniref:hypothetical protein n=1 Tax=Vibrio brasiliensis TaxID=170652 RepID=UPI001EFE0BC4|nr:hypothetical protein [Vibrio brasiliensis]MCG9785371.1 hypothetical protein [Vibrio brasiliensis]